MCFLNKFFSAFIIIGVVFSLPHLSQAQEIMISGEVLDAGNRQPIEFANVIILKSDTSIIITADDTDFDGRFRLVTNSEDFIIEISFIAYKTRRIYDIDITENRLDLGVILLESDTKMLDEVVVRAEKSTTEFKLDKRVFNVGQDLSSAGANALDVLNNVPSVNVNIEGQISLRGARGVQILINGKPSVLASEEGNALGSITAEMIESIEVITNPSAKYEAEGTAGIINIILKKEDKRGMNGSVTLNGGIPHNNNIGLSLNRRTEKWNLFAQTGAGYRELPRDVQNENLSRTSNNTVFSIGEEFRNELYSNIILGTDYYINDRNIITLSGSYTYEVEDQPSFTQFKFVNQDGDIVNEWTREEITEATNPKLQYELQYFADFTDHKDHKLIFSAIGNYFGKVQSSEFLHTAVSGPFIELDQISKTTFEEGKYTFQLDYTKPFKKNITIESGAQYVLNNVGNDFSLSNLIDGDFVLDEGFTNNFEFTQNVLGLYSTAAYESDLWGIKVGLRAENTELNTLLVNTSERNQRNFTNLFPSLHTSYKFMENLSFQAGYSRRIYRPRLWDLNPFFNIRNNFVIRAGNPDLLPEFTDSYEAGLIYILDKLSFNANVYYRYTTEVIERVSSFEDNVTTFKPFNLGTNQTTGVEFNFKYAPSKLLTFNGDVNYNYFRRDGMFEEQVFDFNADQYSGKITSKLKISNAADFEIITQYISRVQTIQGEIAENIFADLGFRYKLFKSKAVINFSVRDIFASRIDINIADQPNFYVQSRALRGRFVTLGFSYGFGKGEAMEYSGKRRR
jgi:outer membrane receptor protein involved in Fe transport